MPAYLVALAMAVALYLGLPTPGHADALQRAATVHLMLRVQRGAEVPMGGPAISEQGVTESVADMCGSPSCARISFGVTPSGQRIVTIYF